MINFSQMDIETSLKLLSGVTALLALLQRIWTSFSNIKKKQALKIDLEILELSKKNELRNSDLLIENLNDKISRMYVDTSTKIDNFRNFLIGIVLFVGFSWWSIDLYSKKLDFNPWIILTGFMAVIGFAMMFDAGNKKNENIENPFFVFEVKRKNDFIIGLSLFIIFGLISWLIILRNGFSFWLILTGIFALLGIGVIISEIRIKTKNK
jgi:hypothetical protein